MKKFISFLLVTMLGLIPISGSSQSYTLGELLVDYNDFNYYFTKPDCYTTRAAEPIVTGLEVSYTSFYCPGYTGSLAVMQESIYINGVRKGCSVKTGTNKDVILTGNTCGALGASFNVRAKIYASSSSSSNATPSGHQCSWNTYPMAYSNTTLVYTPISACLDKYKYVSSSGSITFGR